MLVVTRYRIDRADAATFRTQARRALHAMAEQPGWRGGALGRSTDDPTLWLLTSTWHDVGSYRRALSSYQVKMAAVPLLSQAIDEPTAFEVLTDVDESSAITESETARAADADDVGLGAAAAAYVAIDAGAGSNAPHVVHEADRTDEPDALNGPDSLNDVNRLSGLGRLDELNGPDESGERDEAEELDVPGEPDDDGVHGDAHRRRKDGR